MLRAKAVNLQTRRGAKEVARRHYDIDDELYMSFLESVRTALRPDGLLLLQTCGQDVSRRAADPWIDRYIFPNGCVPSPAQLTAAAEGLFVLEDLHGMGAHYDRTLMGWWGRFERAWPRFRGRHGDRFFRMFRYYMLSCAGAFRARQMQLFQAVLSPEGVPGGDEAVR